MPSSEDTGDAQGAESRAAAPMSGLARLPQSLASRIATAAVAGTLVVLAVFMLAPGGIALAAGAVGATAGWEWGRLAGLRSPFARAIYVLVLAGVGAAAWFVGEPLTWLVVGAAALWWFGFALWLAVGGASRIVGARASAGSGPALALGLLVLPALVLGIGLLAAAPDATRGVLLYALCLVWAADIGAYFAGRAWGRHALSPRISAGKTWEGVAGGAVAVLIYALAAAWLLGVPVSSWLGWSVLAVVAGAVSVVGDLFESLLKRAAGVKDSGTLLPGHGGLLDRVDSLIAAIPIMALGLTLLALGRGS